MLLVAGGLHKQLGQLNSLTHGVPGPLDQQSVVGSSSCPFHKHIRCCLRGRADCFVKSCSSETKPCSLLCPSLFGPSTAEGTGYL